MSEGKFAVNQPVRTEPFSSWPIWDERERQALLDVLESGQWGALALHGTRVAQFEQAFAQAHHAKHGRCVSSGSAALQVALRAVGVDYGDEVIVPPYTFIATASACLSVGAIPVFVDIDPETYNIDPTRIEASITPRTKAIIPVHIGGCPADLDAILAIAHKHNLAVVEDACQAHAAAWNGRRVGAIGDIGCFSFQSSKNINAGEGGIILTDSDELAELCWSFSSYGRVPTGAWYQHERLGDNERMTEWQAAILLAQLTRMEELARRREENALYLASELERIEGILPQKRDPRVSQHAYHLFIFRYDPDTFNGMTRDEFLVALEAEGIPCARGYVPLYETKAIQDGTTRLRKFIEGREVTFEMPDCPVTEKACAEEGVWLTQRVLLGSRADMDDVVTAVRKVQHDSWHR